jgi:protoporphyrinogen oxidase
MSESKFTILGAGLAGISASYHLGHDNCAVFEAKGHAGGHIHTEIINGFTWDEGPHVSFTKSEYVKNLFATSLDQEYLEYPVYPVNYYKGSWISHPAQSYLSQIPEPLRTECFNDFLSSRDSEHIYKSPDNYLQWLETAFGSKFAQNFPSAYTRKYWTLDPVYLTTEWVGGRVFFPDVETVKRGYEGNPDKSTHYITSVRYPKVGGYNSYTRLMEEKMNVSFDKKVNQIDLVRKTIQFDNGELKSYEKLISTLPLPEFVKYCNAPDAILNAAEQLSCSQVLILNFEVNHPAKRTEQWIYVYDEDKLSTRINFTELLSPNNAPVNKCGIQVEVYYSKFTPLSETIETVIEQVSSELIEMGLIDAKSSIDAVNTKWIPYANVIFDLGYDAALTQILDWLSAYGLVRETGDLKPMTNWDEKFEEQLNLGDLILAGRFGQWKYYWTDDCVLRGKLIAEKVTHKLAANN